MFVFSGNLLFDQFYEKMKELFLACALALPASSYTKPSILSWNTTANAEQQLIDWLKKNNPDCEVFINPKPQEGLLKEHGWERFPAKINGKEVWIQRKPKSDKKMLREAV